MVTVNDEAQAELRWGDEARMVAALTRPPPAGLAVTCTDAYAGRVISTTLDRAGRPCTVTVRLRGLRGRQVDVPVGWIEGSDQTALHLRVERRRCVERVIIDPHNRRVAAVLVNGQFPERKHSNRPSRSYDTPLEERRLAIWAADIDFVTPTVVQLSINGSDATGGDDFAPADFVQPDLAWRPPYPYTAADCLWARS